ncbi:MAG: alkaline phosphatase family protein [Blastomonas sp.]
MVAAMVCAGMLTANAPALAQAESAAPTSEERESSEQVPRLAVLIVVDQMRAGYLDELDTALGGGFQRIETGGTRFANAWVDHAYTNSLPGHTSAMTGAYPRNHGVIDNVWHEVRDGEPVVRSAMTLIGRRDGAPYELGRSTISEWFVAANPLAKFAAIGSNAATQIYPGALTGPVYWYSAEGGGYVTGPNFGASVPEWVTEFNEKRVSQLAEQTWASNLPWFVERRLRADDVAFENTGENTHFPHTAAANGTPPLEWISGTPFSDQATLELSAIAIEKLNLGQDDNPDVLTISLNSLDDIGHAYGPFSHEQTDAVLRLDENLSVFMAKLDELVGAGQWVLALTADHGVAPTPEGLRLTGSAEGRRISQEDARRVAEAAYAAAGQVEGRPAKAEAAARAIEGFDFVERAFTEADLAAIEPEPTSREGLFALSYFPGRTAVHPFYFRDLAIADLGVFVLLKEDIMINWGAAIHGSPYDYDRRVPVLYYGAGVAACDRFDRVATVDVATTLAAYFGVEPNNAVDGRRIDLSASACESAALATPSPELKG